MINEKAAIVAATSAAASSVTQNWSIEYFGVPLSVILAGFAGAVVALAFLQTMPRAKMFATVFAGTLTAGYGVKLVAHILGWGPGLLVGLAFVLGLLAHVTLTWFFNSGPKWLADLIAAQWGKK